MPDSKVFLLLNSFNSGQLRKFSEFVSSPFFNKHPQLIQLAHLLIDNIRKQKNAANRSNKSINGLEALSDDAQQLSYLNAKLLLLVYEFLAYEAYDKNKLRKHSYCLWQLRSYSLDTHEKGQIKKYQLERSKNNYASTESYYEDYFFYKTLDKLHLDKNVRMYDENLQKQNDALDIFYLCEKLKIICDMLNRNIVIKANYIPTFIQPIEKIIQSTDFSGQKLPLLQVYYQIYTMLRFDDDNAYQQLINLSQAYVALFLPEELLLMMDYAENYCIRKINNGATSFYEEFLSIIKFKLAHHLLFKDGFIPESDYKNIVTVGVRTKDYTWTAEFMHQYQKNLRPEIRENAFKYNMAVLYFAQKKYEDALQLLMEISFRDISYGVGAKTIQMQIYFALKEYEALINLIDTFRLYVGRHKTQSDYRKKANLNMLRIVKKIVKLKEKSTFLGKHKYHNQLEDIKHLCKTLSPVSNSGWIQDILDNC